VAPRPPCLPRCHPEGPGGQASRRRGTAAGIEARWHDAMRALGKRPRMTLVHRAAVGGETSVATPIIAFHQGSDTADRLEHCRSASSSVLRRPSLPNRPRGVVRNRPRRARTPPLKARRTLVFHAPAGDPSRRTVETAFERGPRHQTGSSSPGAPGGDGRPVLAISCRPRRRADKQLPGTTAPWLSKFEYRRPLVE